MKLIEGFTIIIAAAVLLLVLTQILDLERARSEGPPAQEKVMHSPPAVPPKGAVKPPDGPDKNGSRKGTKPTDGGKGKPTEPEERAEPVTEGEGVEKTSGTTEGGTGKTTDGPGSEKKAPASTTGVGTGPTPTTDPKTGDEKKTTDTGITGTGTTNAGTSTDVSGKRERVLDFEYRNVEIEKIVKDLAESMDKNFIIPKTLIGKVTVIVNRPLPKSEAFTILQTILDSQGFTMYEGKHFIRIEKYGPKLFPTPILFIKGQDVSIKKKDELLTVIVVLQYIQATDITQLLNSVKSASAFIHHFPKINALFIRDTQRHLDYLLSIISKLDQPGSLGQKITFVRLLNSAANETAAILNQVAAVGPIPKAIPGPPTPGVRPGGRGAAGIKIKIIPDKRTNSIIIIATEKETEALLELVSKVDAVLDIPVGDIHTFQCNNQDAKDLATTLEKFVSKLPDIQTSRPGGGAPPPIPRGLLTQSEIFFIADESTNTIIISAPPQEWPFYHDLLVKLDEPQKQVLIEMWVVEVSSDDELSFGVEFRPSDEPPNLRTGPLRNEFYGISQSTSSLGDLFGGGGDDGLGGSAVGAGATIGVRALTATELSIDGRKVRIPNFDVFLRAVKDKSSVKILSSPKLMTLNHKKAIIKITEEISIRTAEITQIESTGGVSTTDIGRTEVGITLEIEPSINAENFVIMDLKMEVSNIVGDLTLDPRIAKRETESTIRCENKQTIVISGLRREDKTKSKTGIPILGDIPLLGRLFSSTTEISIKTNLLIFITPHIVTETSEMLAITEYIKNQRLQDEAKRLKITGKRRKRKGDGGRVVWKH